MARQEGQTDWPQLLYDRAGDAAFYAAVDVLTSAPDAKLRALDNGDEDIVAAAAHHVVDQRVHDGTWTLTDSGTPGGKGGA